ncbi:MAG: hypothetical protein R2881_07955 [Eubacteriales bacterium]
MIEQIVEPIRRPPTNSGPSRKPETTGTMIAINAGISSRLGARLWREDFDAGFVVRQAGSAQDARNFLNWRRTSSTILRAAL